MHYKRVKITTFVPSSHADTLRDALGNAGAGNIGEYSFCSFTTEGTGRFLPSRNAKPHIGTPETLEAVPEERIEVVCELAKAKQAITALRGAHPYEEVAFDICPLLEEEDL